MTQTSQGTEGTADTSEAVARIEDLAAASGGLVVFNTVAPSGTPHSSVVNAGVLAHPTTGRPTVAIVALGGSRKLRHLERDPRAVVVFRDGRRWTAVRGTATIVGPDHPHEAVTPEALPELLRDAYRAAGGGEHPDWDEYDRTMAADRRALVLVSLDHTYGNYWPAQG
ncbi:TIGR03618 family F420-dependent PPOX class oxidoreductase [Streptomyces sp. NPDC001663]|uniref:TIGR03618 family F420-dependent PPOX class oxidoreductase n=1 Tax=Streptomyces sp. NPDC001663 TaxID=3364597 RepID=UPI0036CB78CA